MKTSEDLRKMLDDYMLLAYGLGKQFADDAVSPVEFMKQSEIVFAEYDKLLTALGLKLEETMTKKCKGARKHCWHWTGGTLESMPPKYEMVCCWCGKQKTQTKDPTAPKKMHGKHNPGVFREGLSHEGDDLQLCGHPRSAIRGCLTHHCALCEEENDE